MISELLVEGDSDREVSVKAHFSSEDFSDDLSHPSFTVEVPLTGGEAKEAMEPTMTVFEKEDGTYDVDDVIEMGDKDFFPNEKVENAYFDLVEGIRGYGKEKEKKPGAFLVFS